MLHGWESEVKYLDHDAFRCKPGTAISYGLFKVLATGVMMLPELHRDRFGLNERVQSFIKMIDMILYLGNPPAFNGFNKSIRVRRATASFEFGRGPPMRTYDRKLKTSYLFGIAVLGIVLALALIMPQRASANNDDPPSRVARLSYARGNVSFEPAGTEDWVQAVVNRPVTTGDRLWSDNGGRAELNIGSASIRLAGATGFSFLNLSDNVTQLRLTQGSMRVRVRRLDRDETFEIDTPNLAFSVLRPGIYRINVNEGGDTTVIQVRDGRGEVTGGGSAYNLQSGQSGRFSGTDRLYADVQGYGREDDFDYWSAERDRHEDRAVSARYVSSDVVGYEDLDDYGGWRNEGEYGMVWFPRTRVAGWAPYHYGHWAYIYPWGYTWVDDEPWGFAPFHYGRWVNVSGSWGWVPCPPREPGVVYVRPVYAPALVAWVGGPHFSIGVSVGRGFEGESVGWFPLGPREVFIPSYPVSRTYVTNVNISNTTVNTTVINNYYNTTVINKNTTVVNQTFVNQRVPGAVAATTPHAFTSAQPVARNQVPVNLREVASAPVSVATPPVQQQAIEANGGKPPAMSQVRQIQATSPQAVHTDVKIAPPAQLTTPKNAQGNNVQGNNPQGNTQGNKAGQMQGPPSGVNQPGQGQQNPNNKPGNATGNAGNANTGGKTFEDRPPSTRPNGGNAQGQPNVDNKQNNPGSNTGNPNAGHRTFEGRPPSAQPNGGNVQGQPNVDNKQTNPGGNTGNPNTGHKTLEDRPPSSRPNGGNVQGQPNIDNKQNNPGGNAGNPNAGHRTFEDRPQPPRPNGGNVQGQPSPDNRQVNPGGNSGNPNAGHRTFEGRPPSTQPNGGNSQGPPSVDNRQNNPNGNTGNPNSGRRPPEDRPPSARPNGGNVQGQPSPDRPPAARPGGGNPPGPPPNAGNPPAGNQKPPDQHQQEQKKQPPPDNSKPDDKKKPKDDHPG